MTKIDIDFGKLFTAIMNQELSATLANKIVRLQNKKIKGKVSEEEYQAQMKILYGKCELEKISKMQKQLDALVTVYRRRRKGSP